MSKAKTGEVLKKGDRVQWTSQAGGSEKKKEGTVVAVVPEGKNPEDFAQAYMDKHPFARAKSFGGPRKGTSYLVEVGPEENGKVTQLYYPRTPKLRFAPPLKAAARKAKPKK